MSEKLFPIPFALWLIVTVAWFVGADGFTIRSTSGQVVNLDFSRKYDHAARLLASSPRGFRTAGCAAPTCTTAW